MRILCPKEIVLKIVEYAKIGFTSEEAKEHMDNMHVERQLFADKFNKVFLRRFDLCTGVHTFHDRHLLFPD